jgi:hypothetical protein
MSGFECGVGLSTQEDLVAAAREAATSARAECPKASFALVLVTDNYDPAPLVAAGQAAAAIFPGSPRVAGGTVSGITLGENRFDALNGGRAVAVVALGGDKAAAAAALVADPSKDPEAAGRRLGEEVKKALGGHVSAAMLLSPGVVLRPLPVDHEIVAGIESALPNVPLAGGGLGGGMDGTEMLVGHAFIGEQCVRASALLVGFSGVSGRCGIANGLTRTADAGTITELGAPNIIKTIDGKPARDVALDVLGGSDERARAFLSKSAFIACVDLGLTFAEASSQGDACWPQIPGSLSPDGSVVDYFSPRLGRKLVVARMDREACLAAVDATAAMLRGPASGGIDLVLSFSCSVRGITLGPSIAGEDIRLRQRANVRKHLGMTMHGEIGRFKEGPIVCTGWSYAALALWGN